MNINRWINYLLIAFAFAFPLSIAAANIILALLVLLWLIEGDFKNKWFKIKHNKVFWILALLLFLLILSTLFSSSYTQGFKINDRIDNQFEFIKRFFWIGTFYLIAISSMQQKTINKMVNSFLLAMFINEIISYSVYFQLIDIGYFKKIGLLYTRASPSDPSPMNHSFYSLYLAITILLLLYKIFYSKNSYFIKLSLFFFLASASINLFVNAGRTGQLAIIIGVLIFIIFHFKNNKKLFFGNIFIIVLILYLAYNFSPNFKKRMHTSLNSLITLIKHQNFSTSWGERIALDISSFNYLISSPQKFILGAGAGIAKKEYLEFTQLSYPLIYKTIKHERTLHNQYLQSWLDGTIFSLFLLFYLFFILFKNNSTNNIALRSALIVIFAFSFISDVMIYYSKTLMLFLFVIIIIQYYNEVNNGKI